TKRSCSIRGNTAHLSLCDRRCNALPDLQPLYSLSLERNLAYSHTHCTVRPQGAQFNCRLPACLGRFFGGAWRTNYTVFHHVSKNICVDNRGNFLKPSVFQGMGEIAASSAKNPGNA
ncbi:unnamed protein product, partial [Ectocarpus sp. 13 AM-2016]